MIAEHSVNLVDGGVCVCVSPVGDTVAKLTHYCMLYYNTYITQTLPGYCRETASVALQIKCCTFICP